MAIKSLSIRIDEKLLNQLHVVADYEGRSANSQILILIRENVRQFEEKHHITFDETDPKNKANTTNRI